MAKMKKFQRVEIYLQKLKEQGKASDSELMKLHYRDLMGLPEMEGIGDRTISNALKAFKKKLGVLPQQDTISKRQRVRNYLDDQMQSGRMTSDELMELRFQDLMDKPALKGIGKTTISCTLSIYKKNYEKNVFESNILNFLDKEKNDEESTSEETVTAEQSQGAPITKAKAEPDDHILLSTGEISVLRQMVDQYKQNQYYLSEQKDLELKELKLALHFSGIDCKRILELYWNSRKEVVVPMANLIQSKDKNLFSLESA